MPGPSLVPRLATALALVGPGSLATAAAQNGAVAEAARAPRPVTFAELGWRVERLGERIEAIVPVGATATPVRFPAPQRRVDVARYADGSVVVLVGGVETALGLLFFSADGELRTRVETASGRRMPPGFGGGRGTWPLAVGEGLWIVFWDEDDHVAFRAWAPAGPVAGRQLPFAVEDVEVRFDPELGIVRLRFEGVEVAPVVVPHPRAAVLRAAADRLEFAAVGVRQQVRVRNLGEEPFRGAARIEGAGFVVGGGVLTLPPGADASIAVERVGAEGGESLLRVGDGPGAVTVVLVARPAEPAAAPVAAAEPDTTAAPDALARPEPVGEPTTAPRTSPAVEPEAPVAAAAPPVPPRGARWIRVEATGQRWLAAGRVSVGGRLRGVGRLPAVVEVANLRRGGAVVVPVRPDGTFRARLEAVAWDGIICRTLGGEAALRISASPGGFVADGEVVLMTLPGGPFVVARAAAGGVAGPVELGAGRAGPDGVARLRLATQDTEVLLVVPHPEDGTTAIPLPRRAVR